MKRYKIVDAEMEYEGNIKAVEDSNGEWVKYEDARQAILRASEIVGKVANCFVGLGRRNK